ncbi:MAG: hypothetical protein ABIU29_11555 [Chthoniobacterales bacterium]
MSGTIDWSTAIDINATTLSYGLNVYNSFDPAIAGNPGNPTYQTNVAAMKAGIIRYHYGGETTQDSRLDSRSWVLDPDIARYRWDRRKINSALTNAYTYGPEVIMNIANWPGYLATSSSDYRLDPARYGDFARFCAALVRIVNKDPRYPGRHVQRWEVFNELENGDGVNSTASMRALMGWPRSEPFSTSVRNR